LVWRLVSLSTASLPTEEVTVHIPAARPNSNNS
jgi:hypothetical protein